MILNERDLNNYLNKVLLKNPNWWTFIDKSNLKCYKSCIVYKIVDQAFSKKSKNVVIIRTWTATPEP